MELITTFSKSYRDDFYLSHFDSDSMLLLFKDGIFLWENGYSERLFPIDKEQSLKFDDLFQEILDRDCQIVYEDSQLIRVVRVARIAVYCFGNRLVEVKQIVKDGSRRFRNFRYVSEKVKLNEFFYEGAIRGISEELGILLDMKDLKYKRASIENKLSGSYPGLMCRYQFFDYTWEMPVEYFKQEGYIADEEGCQTFFEWQPE